MDTNEKINVLNEDNDILVSLILKDLKKTLEMNYDNKIIVEEVIECIENTKGDIISTIIISTLTSIAAATIYDLLKYSIMKFIKVKKDCDLKKKITIKYKDKNVSYTLEEIIYKED